jgi:hypothetical protein
VDFSAGTGESRAHPDWGVLVNALNLWAAMLTSGPRAFDAVFQLAENFGLPPNRRGNASKEPAKSGMIDHLIEHLAPGCAELPNQ